MTPTTRWMRLRSWLAGIAFRLAGILDPAYDVWLDDVPSRFAALEEQWHSALEEKP